MCMLPATISNNVPGTDLSIGADTALNAIVEVRQFNPRRRLSFVHDAQCKELENDTRSSVYNPQSPQQHNLNPTLNSP